MQGILRLPQDKDFPTLLIWRKEIYDEEVSGNDDWPDESLDKLAIDKYRHFTFRKGERDSTIYQLKCNDLYFSSFVKILVISDDANDIKVNPQKAMFDGCVFISDDPNAIEPGEQIGLFRTPNTNNLKNIIDKVIENL